MTKYKCFWIEISEEDSKSDPRFIDFVSRIYYNGTCAREYRHISESEAIYSCKAWIDTKGLNWLEGK